jgi:dihydroorotase
MFASKERSDSVFDLVLQRGTVVTGQGRIEADIAVENGVIATISRPGTLEGRETLDVSGLYVLPGLIDAHVHFRDPGFTYKEDFTTGSRAAAAGGITMVVDMPNTDPRVTSAEIFRAKVAHLEGHSFVDFGLYASLTPENIGNIEELADSGAVGFKSFTALSASKTPVMDDGMMLEALRRVTNRGSFLALHAENQSILDRARERLQAEGRTDHVAHHLARPAIAEEEAINRAVYLAASVSGRLHICHISTAGGVRVIREARRRGVTVTTETTPFYLLLSTDDAERLGSLGVTNPPLRTLEHAEELWAGIADQTIDMVVSEHSPHSPEEKLQENVWNVKSGTVVVQTTASLMLDQINKGRLRLEDVARLCSERVAEVFGFSPRKGRIAIESDGDFTVIDMTRRGDVSGANLLNKTKLTPFEGWQFQGMPVYTIVRGQVVMAHGRILGKPGGRFFPAAPRRV